MPLSSLKTSFSDQKRFGRMAVTSNQMMNRSKDLFCRVVDTQFTKILSTTNSLKMTFESEINELSDSQEALKLSQSYKFSVKLLNNIIAESKKIVMEVFEDFYQHVAKSSTHQSQSQSQTDTVRHPSLSPTIEAASDDENSIISSSNNCEVEIIEMPPLEPEHEHSNQNVGKNKRKRHQMGSIQMNVNDESLIIIPKQKRQRTNIINRKIQKIDEWDKGLLSQYITIEGNKIIQSKKSHCMYDPSAYCKHIVEEGVFRWKFEVKQRGYLMKIGVWKDKGCGPDPRLNDSYTWFLEDNGYCLYPALNQIWMDGKGFVDYGTYCNIGSIIEMILDLNELTLSYIIDGVDYGKAFDIEKCRYRAAVCLSKRGDTVTILDHA